MLIDMNDRRGDFKKAWGPCAVVVGASEGLGAAFARELATRGTDLLLLARRETLLDELAGEIRSSQGVAVRCVPIDVAASDLGQRIDEAIRGLEIGMLVYNAAFAPVGPFLERSDEELRRVAAVNMVGPMLFIRRLAPAMCRRGRGAIVLMSSLSGFQGSPRIAAYAASKAFNTILAEGLWGELREAEVEVVASCAGAIRTPNFAETSGGDAPGTLDPEEVARKTLDGLRRGPRIVPGFLNEIAALLTGRILTRRAAIRLMAANTKDLS